MNNDDVAARDADPPGEAHDRPGCGDTAGAGPVAAQAGKRKSYDWAAIQHSYEETDLTVRQITAVFGVSGSALYRRIDREKWRRRKVPFVDTGTVPEQGPSGAVRPAIPTTASGLRSWRKGLIVRLFEAMDRQLGEIEQQQRGGHALSGAERERHTRQMNIMTRSMEKLTEFHEQEAARETRGRPQTGGKTADDRKSTETRRDPETWRLEIARRVSGLVP